MLRTTAIALAAVATVGIASLTSPSSAEAGWHGHRHHWHAPVVVVRPVYAGCFRKVWVNTYYGGFWKRINVCY